jgi:hypothetical protein
VAQGVSLFFVRIGLYFTAGGRGGRVLNTDFHETVGVLLAPTLAALFLPRLRSGAGGV